MVFWGCFCQFPLIPLPHEQIIFDPRGLLRFLRFRFRIPFHGLRDRCCRAWCQAFLCPRHLRWWCLLLSSQRRGELRWRLRSLWDFSRQVEPLLPKRVLTSACRLDNPAKAGFPARECCTLLRMFKILLQTRRVVLQMSDPHAKVLLPTKKRTENEKVRTSL